MIVSFRFWLKSNKFLETNCFSLVIKGFSALQSLEYLSKVAKLSAQSLKVSVETFV